MTSTSNESEVGGFRSEVDQQRLGSILILASSLILAIRTARTAPTHSDGLAGADMEQEIEHSVRLAKRVLSYATTRYPALFHTKNVPWYVPTDESPR